MDVHGYQRHFHDANPANPARAALGTSRERTSRGSPGLLSKVVTNGYAFLPEWQVGEDTASIAHLLGLPVALGEGPAVHRLSPKTTTEATPNTYSGLYGLRQFPLHTDLAHWYNPPRYFLLRCERGFEAVPTFLLDSNGLLAECDKTVLARTLVQPRRPIRGQRALLRLWDDTVPRLRWDERFIVPATPAGVQGMAYFRVRLQERQHVELPLFRPGDTLVVDNWRVLHGRASVPPECQERIIARVYFKKIFA